MVQYKKSYNKILKTSRQYMENGRLFEEFENIMLSLYIVQQMSVFVQFVFHKFQEALLHKQLNVGITIGNYLHYY